MRNLHQVYELIGGYQISLIDNHIIVYNTLCNLKKMINKLRDNLFGVMFQTSDQWLPLMNCWLN